MREDSGLRMTIHNTYLRNWVRIFDCHLEVPDEILAQNSPVLTTLCGIDDISS